MAITQEQIDAFQTMYEEVERLFPAWQEVNDKRRDWTLAGCDEFGANIERWANDGGSPDSDWIPWSFFLDPDGEVEKALEAERVLAEQRAAAEAERRARQLRDAEVAREQAAKAKEREEERIYHKVLRRKQAEDAAAQQKIKEALDG